MLKLLIHGCSGEMGKTLESIIEEDDNLMFYGFDRIPNSKENIFSDYEQIPEVDVIIDFSHYSVTDTLLSFANKRNKPLVIGTTGIGEKTQAIIDCTSKNIPVFQSNNMSLGIQTLLEMAKIGLESLYDFDLEIIEKHHNKKQDAPSGTAKLIFNTLSKEINLLRPIYGRQGNDNKRKKNDVGIHAIRGGNIVGEHSLLFAGLDEILEIKHTATSKRTFAFGAIEAAKFLSTQKPGLYNMSHLFRKEEQ